MKLKTFLHRIILIAARESYRLVKSPIYWFCIVIGPLLCYAFFTSLMAKGLPSELPIGVVDLDKTTTTRSIIRNLDAFQNSRIAGSFQSFTEAREAIQKGEIYGFYYIPRGTTEKVTAGRQPEVSFYLNYSYLIAGSLLYKDMRTMSELAGGAVGRKTLYAKGAGERQAMAILQPIVIDTHPINNPYLNYAVYLCNVILPGILMLLIFQTTIYSIGTEQKYGTHKEWMYMADNNIAIALTGKLLPQSILFFLIGSLCDFYLYGILHYPCNSGIFPMLGIMLMMVLASQAFGVFLAGLIPSLRMALSVASLWGVVSVSISGFTFPVMAMDAPLQALAWLFPLRHYFLLYVNFALDGFAAVYAWRPLLALFVFMLLPLLVLRRLKRTLLLYKYIP